MQRYVPKLTEFELSQIVDVPDSLFGVCDSGQAEQVKAGLRRAALGEKLVRMAMKGVTASEAARLVGCHQQTALMYYKRPDFRKRVMNKIQGAFEGVDEGFSEELESMHEKLKRAAEKSYDELMAMLSGEVAGVQVGHKIKIAQDFMNRNPDTQAGFIHRNGDKLDPDQLRLAATAAREMDASSKNNIVEMPHTGTKG